MQMIISSKERLTESLGFTESSHSSDDSQWMNCVGLTVKRGRSSWSAEADIKALESSRMLHVKECVSNRC